MQMKMRQLLLIIITGWSTTPLPAWSAPTNTPTQVDRSLGKEPNYEATPKYSLLVLGDETRTKVWMVEDGKRLFLDKNANYDLTDDGPPIKLTGVRNIGAATPGGSERWDGNYLLDAITPTNGSRHTHFKLVRWNYGEKEDTYGLSLSVNDELPMYAGWFGTFWSPKPETAPIMHFGGPFTPKMLRFKEFTLNSESRRLSIGFMNPGAEAGAETRLSIEALPTQVTPLLTIDWPTAAGKPPLQTRHQLSERCCYWEFYTSSFQVPSGVIAGTAKVSVELPQTFVPIALTTTELKVPVAPPTQGAN